MTAPAGGWWGEAAKVAEVFWSEEPDNTNLGKQTAKAITQSLRELARGEAKP